MLAPVGFPVVGRGQHRATLLGRGQAIGSCLHALSQKPCPMGLPLLSLETVPSQPVNQLIHWFPRCAFDGNGFQSTITKCETVMHRWFPQVFSKTG